MANTLGDSVSVVDLAKGTVLKEISLGRQSPLGPAERGEQLFYDARLSLEGWFSCHSCHSDGHSNGRLNDNLGDGGFGNMPKYRAFSTRVLHQLVFSMAARKHVTESTNGFRAFRTALLRDPRIDWRQPWLDRYELEPYLLLKTIRLGYRHLEVPVTKIYPPHQIGYTKMRPFVDWWSIIRPLVYLGLGLRK